MPSLTPRATVVQALAAREAELLDQTPASGHLLVALIWVGKGLAAHVLAEVGLTKGAAQDLRDRLRAASDSDCGIGADESLRSAARIANGLHHGYVGTEHQLLAIVADTSLSEGLFGRDVRERAREGVLERLPKAS